VRRKTVRIKWFQNQDRYSKEYKRILKKYNPSPFSGRALHAAIGMYNAWASGGDIRAYESDAAYMRTIAADIQRVNERNSTSYIRWLILKCLRGEATERQYQSLIGYCLRLCLAEEGREKRMGKR